MKAILVIDMPETCAECSCSYCGDIWRCMAVNGKALDFNISGYEKPSWCPLKPMPKRKNEYTDIDAIGWNDCLDSIEGRTK